MRTSNHLQHITVCLLVCMSVFRPVVRAQNLHIDSITIADGLSQGMIYDIEQTDDGFLWFATKDGLNRYDGYHFEVFTNDPYNPFSISGNDVHRIFEDSRGNLWVSVSGKGLDVMEKNSGKFLHLPLITHLDNIYMSPCVTETPDGTIWVATVKGLLHLKWNSPLAEIRSGLTSDLLSYMTMDLIQRKRPQGNSSILLALAQSDGTILTSDNWAGVCRYNPAKDQFTILSNEVRWGDILFLLESTRGRAWMIISDKVCVIEHNGNPRPVELYKPSANFSITNIFSDGNGNLLWTACSPWDDNSPTKSYFYSAPEDAIIRSGSSGSVKELFHLDRLSPSSCVDQAGNLWAGTNGYGLRKTNIFQLAFQHLLPNKSIGLIIPGDKLFLFYENCYHWYDKNTNISHEPPGDWPKDVLIFKNYTSKHGKSYLMYDDEGRTHLRIKNNSTYAWKKIKPLSLLPAILEDTQGRIWAGGKGALMCILPPDDHIAYLDFPKKLGLDAEVHAFLEDDRKNLWVGTTGGIIRIQMSDLQFTTGPDGQPEILYPTYEIYQTTSSNPRSLRHNFVTSFCPDPQQPQRYLWVSTKGGGLNLLDKTNSAFQHFTSQNSGLPNDVVYGILPDKDGRLWMSTNRGLSRLTLLGTASKDAGSQPYILKFRNFRQSDGLQDDEFNTGSFAKGKDGRLYFGGVRGLTVFDPSTVTERTSDAAVRITGLKINNLPVDYFQENGTINRPVHRTERIRLHPGQSIVTLEFALMDFVSPKENRFRYRLTGIDPDWVEAGTGHSANYTNLPAGNFSFEVQGSIGDGLWSAPSFLEITVLPPWWATWWAYFLYALLLGTTLYTFYKIRLRQKIEHQEALRLQELDAFKSRFFTNITHEFRTPLTVILGTGEQLAAGTGQWVVAHAQSEVKGKLGLIRRNSENLLRLINQILDLAKLESNALKINYVQGDVLPYLRYICESLHSLANAQNVMLRLESSAAEIQMDYDPERLLQIVHNLLSNAIKFTRRSGRVTIFAGVQEHGISNFPSSVLSIRVSDTGVGIPKDDLPYIFDRFYQADNLEKTKAGGTGIGLSLTKELAKAMGGEISVESEPGMGTTFTVLLPISNKATSSEQHVWNPLAMANTSEKPADNSNPTTKSLHHLLLIEDNPDVVEYLTACLKGTYQLDFAYNGRAGIEKALETVPDLIVSDVMMPEKDGYEVCDTLKNDVRSSHIPIVLLTAKADMESRIAGLKKGADAYLAKPFHQEELTVTLENLLQLRHKLQAKYAGTALTAVSPPKSAFLPDPEETFLQKLRNAVESRLSDANLSVDDICKMVGMSHPVIHRKVTALTGRSLTLFVRSIRLARSRELLANPSLTISEVAYEVGFNDPKFFSRVFSEEFGESPSAFRQKI